MQSIQYVIVIGLLLALSACVSATNKQLKLAEQSMAQGNYSQAFDRAAQSLQTDISNHKTIALFPRIVDNAHAQQLSEITQHQANQYWDQAAYGYDRIVSMHQILGHIQSQLQVYVQTMKISAAKRGAMHQLLAIKLRDVTEQRDAVYHKAAAAHYRRAQQYVAAQQHRQAHGEFKQTLSFIGNYKDASALAGKSKRRADLADANMYYGQAVAAVHQQQHRAAARAFYKALSFVANFKDARSLAAKYNAIADQEDALDRYNQAQRLAQQHQYRAAVKAFQAALVFVPGYRDASHLSAHYTHLANQQDARKHYNEAQRLMDQYEFARAAKAFERANQFIPGYRDARRMAVQAKSWLPPGRYELQRLVQASVKHGIPLTWLYDVHEGYTEEVKITSLSVVKRGGFNRQREYWPYRLRLRGTCELEISDNNEQDLSFDTIVDYRVLRDDFGAWKAVLR